MNYIDECFNNSKKRRKLTYASLLRFWRWNLLERIMSMFVWQGIDDIAPQKEIELTLIIKGFCGIVKSSKFDKLIAVKGEMSGVTEYPDEFTTLTYTTPLESGYRVIGQDCIVINNNQIRNPLLPLIEKYAVLLTHADLTLQSFLINVRATGMIAADNDASVASVNAWYNKLIDGDLICVVDKDNLTGLLDARGVREISSTYPSSNSLIDIYTIHSNLLKSFYNDIGVKMSTEKRERLITEEIESDNQMLLVNISDMLKERQLGAKRVNDLFGTNISIYLNPFYETLNNKGGENVEKVDDSRISINV